MWSLTGAAFVDLARWPHARHTTTAIDRLHRALELRGVSLGPMPALDQLSLAEALLYAGDVDEAGRTALLAEARWTLAGRTSASMI